MNNKKRQDLPKNALILGSTSTGQVFNPLKQLLSNTELLLINENISADLSNKLLYNPYTLYKGLLGSRTEINILETEHFKIVGNNLLELKIHKMSEGDFPREKEILLEVTKNLQDILLVQAELN